MKKRITTIELTEQDDRNLTIIRNDRGDYVSMVSILRDALRNLATEIIERNKWLELDDKKEPSTTGRSL